MKNAKNAKNANPFSIWHSSKKVRDITTLFGRMPLAFFEECQKAEECQEECHWHSLKNNNNFNTLGRRMPNPPLRYRDGLRLMEREGAPSREEGRGSGIPFPSRVLGAPSGGRQGEEVANDP